MTTGATGQLGLALPVQGELSGTWGDTVNNGITQYTNIAIAATLTLTGDGAVTLANTTGDASASNITSTLAGAGTVTAQFAMVRISGTTVAKTVTGPSYSKSYIVDNASSYAVTFKASGQTGVSISPGEKVGVYYNGTDYVKIGGGGITYGAVKTTTYTAVSNDGVLTNTTGGAFTVNLPATPATGTQVFIADANGTWGTNNLTVGRNGSTIAGSATDLVCDINSVSIQFVYTGTTWDIFAQIGANDTAVVTLNGTQTLTNKTLTAPTITSPTITGTGTIAAATVTLSSTLAVTGVATLSSDAVVNGLTVGRGAGAVASNTAVGASALAANTTGNTNTAFGYQAGKSVTTANQNTYVGVQAGQNNTGGNNTMIGCYAMTASGSGTDNSGVGLGVLGNNTGSYNTAFGSNALNANTTASNNTAVGYQSAYTNTTGTGLTAIGRFALYANTTGNYNIAMGDGALGANTTASNNTAVGYQALYANTTGANNVSVGYAAGTANTTGTSSVFVGPYAGYVNTTGNGVVAVGNNALVANTSGSYNVGIGQQALNSNTTGANNTSLGYQAGSSVTSGTGVICVGSGSNVSAGTDNYEIVIGYNTTGKGSATAFINAFGGSTYNGANTSTWATTSDRRLKKNIVNNDVGLDKLVQIQVRNFEYRLPEEVDAELKPTDAIKKSGVQLGVIAQELQAVLPECVKQESTGVLTVDTDNLTWYLINAVKELSARVKQLEGN